jgi:hypothetical protein
MSPCYVCCGVQAEILSKTVSGYHVWFTVNMRFRSFREVDSAMDMTHLACDRQAFRYTVPSKTYLRKRCISHSLQSFRN